MTVSIQTDALLSQFAVLAYKDKAYLDNTGNLPTGWKLADSEVRGPFAAFAFQNESNGKVIVAYRGTQQIGDRPRFYLLYEYRLTGVRRCPAAPA